MEEPSIAALLFDLPTKVFRYNDFPLAVDLDIRDDKYWSNVLNVQWNLRASDQDLTEAFLDIIAQERAKRKFNRRDTRWRRTRDPSWRWPEVLDICIHHQIPRLNANDRRKRKEAAAAAKRFYDYLYQLLEDDCRS
jgi:hypothetical protein